MAAVEEGWRQLADGPLAKLVRWAEAGAPADQELFDNKGYMTAFVVAYNICMTHPIPGNSAALYDRVHGFMRDYLDAAFAALSAGAGAATMLPADAAVGRLNGYPTVVKWVKSIFSYLDRFHTRRDNLPPLRDSLNALVRQRLKPAGRNDLERQVLDALAALPGEDLQGNPCSMRRYGVVQMLTCSAGSDLDLDEAPQPPKDALIEAIKTARRHPTIAASWPDPSVGLAGARFGGAAGLLAQAKNANALDVGGLTRAAHGAQRRLRIAAMPRAVTHGLYTADGELAAPLPDLMAVARHRPQQLLLLGALVSRGADSASPLVGAPLVLSADLASKIREALHQMPGLCPRAGPSGTGAPVAGEEFAWHDDTATAGGGAAATGAQGSGKRKREDE